MKISMSYGLAWVMAAGLLIGCSSQEEPDILKEKTVSVIFKDMKKLPAIEDPDPAIEDPDYKEIFEKAYSMRLIDEILADGQVPLHLKELLKGLAKQVRQVSPEVNEKLENVTLDFLMGILDPKNPLDPHLEDVLKKVLGAEELQPSFVEVPVIEGLAELKLAHEENSFTTKTMNAVRTSTSGSECVFEVYDEFGRGARSCGLELENSLGLIEATYFKRLGDTQERFEKRNDQIVSFTMEKLPLVVSQFRRVLTSIRENSTKEEVEEIRSNLGYLAAAFAYHLRINAPLWQEYGLKLNELYYYKELELIEKIRMGKEAEADVIFQHCIDWVNGQIKEEVKRRCPGDEPILY